MVEQISFTFDGRIASENRMDFYESARFQYAASRLFVKLDNFRRTGKFPKKITYKNTPDILILPARRGSFALDVIMPVVAAVGPSILEIPISALISYVIDRVFKSTDDDVIRSVLANERDMIEVFDNAIAGRDHTLERTLDLLRDRIDRDDLLTDKLIQLQERIISDQDRRLLLAEHKAELRKITPEQEADLITMSAPLLKEMNVPLRRSARRLNIRSESEGNRLNIISDDKDMTDEVELAVVDRNLTTIDINIVQFNKQSGWGKFENPEWEGTPTFSVSGDLLDDIKQTIVNAMNVDLVEADCIFVRSLSGIPQRIILIDLRYIQE